MKNLILRVTDLNILHKVYIKFLGNYHRDIFFHVLKTPGKNYDYFFSDFNYHSGIFIEQMKWLKKLGFHPVSLTDYYNNPSEFKDKKTFSVSTDDGYAENYFEHLPILKKEKIPCIFYLCNNVIDNQQFLWADRLFFLKNKNRIPSTINKIADAYGLPHFEHGKDDLYKWSNSWPMNLANEISSEIWKASDCGDERDVLQQILPYLTTPQVKEIIDSGFEIGSHSKSHFDISRLDYQTAYDEIVGSFEQLNLQFNQNISYFAYPYGRRAKKNDEEKIIEATKARLFAGTKNCGTNQLSSSIYQRDDMETTLIESKFYFSALPLARKYVNPLIKVIKKWKP